MATVVADVGANVAGKAICPSLLTGRSENVVVSSFSEVKITVTRCTLLSEFRDTDVTCGAESGLDPLRSKIIVGLTASSLVGQLTIKGVDGPSYSWV